MAEFAGPMLRRWELGNALRRIREERGMTIAEVTAAMKERYGSSFSTTKLSRMETARRGVIPRDVHDLCLLYGVSEAERAHLMKLAQSARGSDEWHEQVEMRDLTRLIALEQIATRMREYSSMYMPGLFQTAEYAVLIERHSDLAPDLYNWAESAEDPPDRVATRMQRQTRLEGPDPLQIHAVIDENVLLRRPPASGVMAGQLRHLLAQCQKPNIVIQIIPLSVGLYPGAESTDWCLLDLPEIPGQPSASGYVEAVLGGRWVEREADISRLSGAFDTLTQLALSAQESAELVRHLLKTITDSEESP